MSQCIHQPYVEIIARHLASPLERRTVTTFEGNDHLVFVIDGSYAFRFPKSAEPSNVRRAAFLTQLRETVPVSVPAISVHQDPMTGIWYETYPFIPGVSFDPSLARSFSAQDLRAIARQLGAFLGAVHNFPIDQARKLGLDEMQPELYGDYLENHPDALPLVRQHVYSTLSASEQDWIETLFKTFTSLIKRSPFQTRVTHADLWPQHILIDPKQRRATGVIDFWGRIADPANDFKVFELYGQDFVLQTYRSYPLKIDGEFEQRRLFYTGHDVVMQLARAISAGDPTTIQDRQQSLRAYIATHPIEAPD